MAVWLYGERLTLAFSDEPLAQYTVAYQPDKRHLKAVTAERLFETPHRSPQQPLWDLGDGEWLRVLRLPDYAPRTRRTGDQGQLPRSCSMTWASERAVRAQSGASANMCKGGLGEVWAHLAA